MPIAQNEIDELYRISDDYFQECFLAVCADAEQLQNWLIDPPENATPELIAERFNEYQDLQEWLELYTKISRERSEPDIIQTPPLKPKIACIGCAEDQLNQQGHYGGCLPDPLDIA